MSCGSIAFAASTALFAQTAPPPSASAQKPLAGVVASVTLTGCIERWSSEATPSPTGAPTEKAPAGAEYVLTNVDGQAASANAAGGGKPTQAQAEKRYLLLSTSKQDFAPHVNHTVKIVGTIAPQPSEGASPAERAIDPSKSETNLPERPSEAYQANLVEVSSLTMVSRECGK